MEGQAIVVVYDSLRGRFAAWVAACQDLADFIVVVKLRKVFEALHMVGVVAEDAVERGVAHLQTPHVDGNHGDTRLKDPLIVNQQSVGIGDATDEDIHGARHLNDVVHNREMYIGIGGEAVNKQLGLVLVA